MGHSALPRVPREGPNARWYGDLEAAIQHYNVVVDVTSVSGNTTDEQTFTVPGVNSHDVIIVNKPTHNTGLGIVNVRASAKDTIAITFMNTTAGSINPSSETYSVIAIRG